MRQDTGTIIGRLHSVRQNLLAVAAEIPPDRWRVSPTGGGWSAAEVIAHLTMVEEAVTSGASRAVQKEPRPVSFWKRWHIPPAVSVWRFPRAKTPMALDAALVGEKETMLARFAAARERTLAFLEANHALDLSRWRHPHPFFGSLHLYDWFRTLYYHETRHTKQLRDILRSI